MARTISRRGLFAAAAAGFAAPTVLGNGASVAAQTPQRPGSAGLPDVWGQDFLYQWSPPENVTRDLKPGTSQLRLSAQVPTDTGIQMATVVASVQGDTLTVSTTQPFGGMPGNATLKITETWSLSPDGKVLTVKTERDLPALRESFNEVYNRR